MALCGIQLHVIGAAKTADTRRRSIEPNIPAVRIAGFVDTIAFALAVGDVLPAVVLYGIRCIVAALLVRFPNPRMLLAAAGTIVFHTTILVLYVDRIPARIKALTLHAIAEQPVLLGRTGIGLFREICG